MAEERGEKRHFYDVIRGFKNAFLVTHRANGTLHARPLAVAEITAQGRAYFATSTATPKVDEILADQDVLLTFQSPTEFATLGGTARIVRDPALIGRLWSEDWREWVPGGRDDPSLCIIEVSPREGEFWASFRASDTLNSRDAPEGV